MVNIETLLAQAAQDLTFGVSAHLAERVQTPTQIAIGTKSIYVETQQDLIQVLDTYRANLDVEGYSHTELTLIHVQEAPDGALRVYKDWVDRSHRGAVISHMQISKLCTPTQEGWTVSEYEIVEPPHDRLLSGLPIH